MTIKTKFNIYEEVELVHDRAKETRMVTGFSVRDKGTITYNLSCGAADSWHYEEEIQKSSGQSKAGFIK